MNDCVLFCSVLLVLVDACFVVLRSSESVRKLTCMQIGAIGDLH